VTSHTSQQTKILIVDDNDRVRDAMSMRVRMSRETYYVCGAGSGREALACLAKESFDIVLCDLVLKGEMDGITTTEAILKEHGDVRIVVFSGFEAGDRKVQVLKAGAFSYLAKPINHDELLHSIEMINSIRRTERLERSFRTLARISHQLQASFNFDEVADRVVRGADDLGFRRARLYLYDAERHALVGKVGHGIPKDILFEGYEMPIYGSPMVHAIFEADRPMIWDRERIVAKFGEEAAHPWVRDLGLEDAAWIDLPLIAGNEQVGTLAVDDGAAAGSYSGEDLEILDVFAGLAAKALNNARMYEKEALANASLGSILRDAPDAVITTDLAGVVNFVSPSGHRVTGYPAEKMVGHPAARFYTDEKGADVGLTVAHQIMQQLRAEGTISNQRVLLKAVTGNPRPVSLSASLLRNDRDEAIGTLGILKDLGAIEAQSEQYRDLLEGFGYGTLFLNAEGRIRFINRKAARLLKHSCEEAEGRNFNDMVLSSQRPQFAAAFREVIERGTETRLDFSVLGSGDSRVAASARLTPVKSRQGVTGVALAFYDKGELGALIQSGRLMALGQMVAGVAHEINNPLNNVLVAVREMASRLEREDTLTDKNRQYADMIERNGHRIQSIVVQLRDFAKPTTFERRPVALASIVEDALAFFRTRFHNHNIILHTDFAADLPDVMADANRIQQVLVNLIVNAEEAMEGQGECSLELFTAAAAPGWAEVHVTDTGSGIPEEIMEVIFDPFFTTKSPNKGTGLGLAISKSILDMHKGTIRVARGPEGKGTRFIIALKTVEVHDDRT
jgi:PAS domain S-box-containing protein